MKYSIIALLMLFFTFSSCISKKKVFKISIHLKDSVVNNFPYSDEYYTAIYPIIFQGSNWLLHGNTIKGYTALTGIDNENKNKYIKLDTFKQIKSIYQIQSFEYISEDSVLGISPALKKILIFNLAGEMISEKPMSLKYDDQEISLSSQMWGWPFAYNKHNNQIYYPIRSIYRGDNSYFRLPKFVTISQQNDTANITSTYGGFPSWYTHEYMGNLNQPNIYFFNKKILVNYYLSDSLYQYSNKGELLHSYRAKSDYVKFPPKLFDIKKKKDKDYINEYTASYSVYQSLITNSFSPYLFRVIEHGYHYYNEDSTTNELLAKPWGIVVIDANMNKVGEINIGYNKLSYLECMPYKNGFWARALNSDKYYYYEITLDR